MLLKFVLTLALLDVICVFGGFLPRTVDNGVVDPNGFPALGQRSHVPSRESRQVTDTFLETLRCNMCLYIIKNTTKELAGDVTEVTAIVMKYCGTGLLAVQCRIIMPQVAQAISKGVANGTEVDDLCDGPELCAVQNFHLTPIFGQVSNRGQMQLHI